MKILTPSKLSTTSEATLQQAGFEVLTTKVAQEQLENYINDQQIDVVITNNSIQIHQELIDACPSLKLIGISSSTEHIDIEYAKEQGLHIIHTTEASANAVAELIFAHLLGMVRFLHQANREMPLEGDMNFNGLKKLYQGTELRGKTLGLIGMDATAIATAKIALGLGMQVVMSNHEPKSVSIPLDFFDGQGIEFTFEAVPLNEVLKNADFISLHTSDIEGYVLSTAEFEQMKTGVGVVNCTSSNSLDELALVKAIESGNVKYAGLDVFENQPNPEIQLLMNVDLSLSPNIHKETIEAKTRADMELANKIIERLNQSI